MSQSSDYIYPYVLMSHVGMQGRGKARARKWQPLAQKVFPLPPKVVASQYRTLLTAAATWPGMTLGRGLPSSDIPNQCPEQVKIQMASL